MQIEVNCFDFLFLLLYMTHYLLKPNPWNIYRSRHLTTQTSVWLFIFHPFRNLILYIQPSLWKWLWLHTILSLHFIFSQISDWTCTAIFVSNTTLSCHTLNTIIQAFKSKLFIYMLSDHSVKISQNHYRSRLDTNSKMWVGVVFRKLLSSHF